MRLLHVRSLTFETYYTNAPAYCILSHRWEEEEVSYVDMTSGRDLSLLKGYRKIRNAALIAEQEGLSYIWIDTCCIDKRSSTELSEAINSMASWYAASKVCIVHLFDVLPMDVPIEGPSGAALRASIYRSEWCVQWSQHAY